MTRKDVEDAVEYHLQNLETELADQLLSGKSTLGEITRCIEDVNLLFEFEDTLYEIQNDFDRETYE